MMNGWLIEHWGSIVEIFLWGFSILMLFALVWTLYKMFTHRFAVLDAFGLCLSIVWLLLIIFFGFDHVRAFLLGILSSDYLPL
jgi:hypothetical protein